MKAACNTVVRAGQGSCWPVLCLSAAFCFGADFAARRAAVHTMDDLSNRERCRFWTAYSHMRAPTFTGLAAFDLTTEG